MSGSKGAEMTRSRALKRWVEEAARLTRPDRVHWCDGSEEERRALTEIAVGAKTLIPLNEKKRPNCYLHRSVPNDVARSEDKTFICAPTEDDAGPTNNWKDPAETYKLLTDLSRDSMKGRTLYVVPYVMAPTGSRFAKVGVELTDSVYVALNMRIMTRMGKVALDLLGESDDFSRGFHCTLD